MIWFSGELKFWLFLFSHFNFFGLVISQGHLQHKNISVVWNFGHFNVHVDVLLHESDDADTKLFLLDILYFGFVIQLNYFLPFQKYPRRSAARSISCAQKTKSFSLLFKIFYWDMKGLFQEKYKILYLKFKNLIFNFYLFLGGVADSNTPLPPTLTTPLNLVNFFSKYIQFFASEYLW